MFFRFAYLPSGVPATAPEPDAHEQGAGDTREEELPGEQHRQPHLLPHLLRDRQGQAQAAVHRMFQARGGGDNRNWEVTSGPGGHREREHRHIDLLKSMA